MRIFAMIPARSGSKGLPSKNIAEVDGHPLIGHAVTFAAKLGVDRVVVSTDSDQYAKIASWYDPTCVVHARGEAASSDTAMEEDIVADYVAQGKDVPDVWIWVKPTSPFRRVDSVLRGIAILRDMPFVDSVRIVSEADARLQTIDERGYLEWYGTPGQIGRSKMRRTEVPQVYKPFALEIFRHVNWADCPKLFMGTMIHPVVDSRITAIDVDDLDDLQLVDAIMRLRPRPDWLAPYVHL